MGCGWGGSRMEFQTMGSRKLLSRFMFGVTLIWMASTVLLCQKPAALLWTLVPSQLIQWLVFWTWTALPFLGSPRLTACLCSLSLTFSVFLRSFSHTAPVCFCSEVLVITCVSSLSRVLIGLTAGFTLSGGQIFYRSSH